MLFPWRYLTFNAWRLIFNLPVIQSNKLNGKKLPSGKLFADFPFITLLFCNGDFFIALKNKMFLKIFISEIMWQFKVALSLRDTFELYVPKNMVVCGRLIFYKIF